MAGGPVAESSKALSHQLSLGSFSLSRIRVVGVNNDLGPKNELLSKAKKNLKPEKVCSGLSNLCHDFDFDFDGGEAKNNKRRRKSGWLLAFVAFFSIPSDVFCCSLEI